MVNKLAFFLLVLVLISLLIFPLVLKNKEENFSSRKKDDTYVLSGLVIVGHEDGKKQWEINVKKVLEQGKDETLLEGIEKGKIYDNGQVKYFLTADHGKYWEDNESLLLEKNILVTSTEGEILKTDRLEYSKKSNQMKTGEVKIKKEDLVLWANEMKLDIDEDIYHFMGNVTIEFEITDSNEDDNGGA